MMSPVDTGKLLEFEESAQGIGFCDPRITKRGWSLVPLPMFFSAPEYVRYVVHLLLTSCSRVWEIRYHVRRATF
jgi:hypothetical protein